MKCGKTREAMSGMFCANFTSCRGFWEDQEWSGDEKVIVRNIRAEGPETI